MTVSSQLQKVDTYDVYDDYDQLVKTIPPGALVESSPSNLGGSTGTVTESLCYNYEYDNLFRLSRKKIPGADWALYYYNGRDMVAFVRDGNMKAWNSGKYMVTQYDAVGRALKTGVKYVGGPTTAVVTAMALTADDPNFTIDSVYTISVYDANKNRVTQTSERVLGNYDKTADAEWPVNNYTYDDFNQVTGVVGNNIWNKTETKTFSYNDAGQAPVKTYTHTGRSGGQNGCRMTMEYDQSLRLKNEYHETMDYAGHYTPKIQVSERNYNHLDQVVEKNIGWVKNRFCSPLITLTRCGVGFWKLTRGGQITSSPIRCGKRTKTTLFRLRVALLPPRRGTMNTIWICLGRHWLTTVPLR